MAQRDSRLIYTTDPAEAKRLREKGEMPRVEDIAPDRQSIKVELDKKRRRGKTVTVASGFQLSPESLQDLSKHLRKRCGAGGSAGSDHLEVQGDHVETVTRELKAKGFRVR